MNNVSKKLKSWREERAKREGIEPFRVLSNSAIEEIAEVMPQTQEELLGVKGIKEKKFEKYGREILEIVREAPGKAASQADLFSAAPADDAEKKIFTVSTFLDLLNIGLRTSEAKIMGEVSSCDFRGNYLFFTLKDKTDGSAISCFMWQREYKMSGVTIAEGMEIMVHGFPEIYKPSGRLSFHGDSVELVGEGALKKAYDEMKLKLEREGLFSPERKRAIPEYPEKIGLITSRTGAVIHDFLNNIGKFGYQIKFIDSRVEGQLAVSDLLGAVRSFRNKDIDMLVIIRGGGSLESLLAFNNETLVREISRFPKPVICGIGHDKDMPLVALAADMAVSTPTAVTRVLNSSWEQALSRVRLAEREIFGEYQEMLLRKQHALGVYSREIKDGFSKILKRLAAVEQSIKNHIVGIGYEIEKYARQACEWSAALPKYFAAAVRGTDTMLASYEKQIMLHDPERQLKLGYGIARINGKVIRNVRDAHAGDMLDLTLADGMIGTEVREISPKD